MPGQTSPQVALDLWPAIDAGLLLPLNDAYKFMSLDVDGLADTLTAVYKFAHDRIQHTAYDLIPEESRAGFHLTIGRSLLRAGVADQDIFTVADCFQAGRTLLKGESERDRAAALFLCAGRSARSSAAYKPMRAYLESARAMLPPEQANWERSYSLMTEVYSDAAEAAYLNGDFDEVDHLFHLVDRFARDRLDKVRVYEIRIQTCTARGALPEAVAAARHILKILDCPLPSKLSRHRLQLIIDEIRDGLQDPMEMLHHEAMTDPRNLAAVRILDGIFVSCFVAEPSLAPYVACLLTRLSMEGGNAPQSINGYLYFGLVLCAHNQDFSLGYRYSRLARALAERLDAGRYLANLAVISSHYIDHFARHHRESLVPSREGYRFGLNSGDIAAAANCLVSTGLISFLIGAPLPQLEREMADFAGDIAALEQGLFLNYHRIHWQAVSNWLNPSKEPYLLVGSAYDEERELPEALKQGDVA
ncbi:MAG: hypothetical protein MI867_29615, partial [Pseudomonadales bacterium]|nr:hypothetical protein [Pseudomonadales bacterium]